MPTMHHLLPVRIPNCS